MRATLAHVFASCKRGVGALKHCLSTRTHGREWDMLQKQEHLYASMFTSGQVLVESHGEETEALVEGLRLQWSYGFPFTPKDLPVLTHAFHAYPAGMQPATARHLLTTVLPGKSVLDPFVGGGTVIVEALRAGRFGMGSDISPLSLFVSRGRTWTPSQSELEDLREASRSIRAATASKLEDAKARQIRGKDWEVIKREINNYLNTRPAGPSTLRDALWFVCAVAASRAAKARRRRDKFLVANEFFHLVCVEYARAVQGLTEAAIAGAAPCLPQKPLIIRRDARNAHVGLETLVHSEGQASFSGSGDGHLADDFLFHSALTSPPYPGVYDYLAHARQTRSVLGEMAQEQGQESSRSTRSTAIFFETRVPTGRNWAKVWTEGEIGSKHKTRRERRKEVSSSNSSAFTTTREAQWERDQRGWISATAGALREGGRMCVLIGDGDGIDTRSSILTTVEEMPRDDAGTSLRLVGWATFKASEGARRSMRTEHLVLFEKTS